jgi:glycerophosphoryl diester phosphodiesterase
MDTVKLINKKNCKMIAHRGLSYIECENSMPAFVAAGNRSY